MAIDGKNRQPLGIEAVIFDMDGLMLDTERLNRAHFRRAATDFGYVDLETVYLETFGVIGRTTGVIGIVGPARTA
jgi:beta-phosphoglucomutase-like phosphatase (HAD superfamily)